MNKNSDKNEKKGTKNNNLPEDNATLGSPHGTKVNVNDKGLFFTCQQCGVKLPSYTAYQIHFENCEK